MSSSVRLFLLPVYLFFSCTGGGPEVEPAQGTVEEEEYQLAERLDNLRPQNGSSLYNMAILSRYTRIMDQTLGGVKGRSVLEIGPGRNLAAGVMMVVRGARRYSAVDIYEHPELYEPIVYHNMRRLAQAAGWNVSAFDELVRIDDGRVQLHPDRIEWLYPYESYAFPIPEDGLDFVFSHSGFEHFNEPMRTVDRIFEALKPGGVTAHSIDLRDHRDFSQPYAFLELGAEEWRAQFTDATLHNFTNRWRAGDFVRAFEGAGFQILEDDRLEGPQVTQVLRETFHPDFRHYSLEELSAVWLRIVARKPEIGGREETG